MDEADYPALYRSATTVAVESQQLFFRAFLGHMVLLALAAVISVANSEQPEPAIAQVLVLVGALGCAIFIASTRPERQWYAGRAVAESIKTTTWRYMSRSEPFHHVDAVARFEFGKRLADIVDQNREIAKHLIAHLDQPQISTRMDAQRTKPVDERLADYRQHRIVDQQSWYANKAAWNRRMAKRSFVLLIVILSIGILLAVAKVAHPKVAYWPTDVVVAVATALLGWIQAKRFQELSSSYALTAHEISLIREQSGRVMTDEQFSRFVGDAENAFSREHTQWIARVDH